MTRSSDPNMVAARARPGLVSRDFVSIAGRDRDDNSIHWLHLWSGINTVTAPVIDIDTGSSTDHDFSGDDSLLAVDAITFVCEQQITERTLSITLNPIREIVNDFCRTYDLHEQAVFVYQGDFDPETMTLVSPAECVFAGFVDTAPINEGAVDEPSAIVIEARSHVTEMTRTNTLKRSHASEILRDPNDTFYQDTGVVGDWLTYLGQDTPKQMKAALR
jgi:hypothetical protein